MPGGDAASPALAAAVQAALAALLPPGWAAEVCRLADPHGLHPAEAAAVAQAVPQRRREFAAGRAALRRALAASGRPVPGPILPGPDRRPVLPPDVAVSLAHDRGLAIAVAGPVGAHWPGVDVEPLDAAAPDLAAAVAPFDGCDGLTAFVAKEAAFKAQFPETGALLEFSDVALAAAGQRFAARMPAGVARGQLLRAGGRIIALAWFPRSAP
ncbi:4-phosphopantetheinyl transferase [Paracoccus luteus]|uniref:4-phosphopantetheinyl transferase n=1 Tax=Paracoccus luteus TaxID=2508543 RepID=UPI00106F1D2D|nr:4-phosphopantetheinyl transferase [Paracoccus luteus]